VQRKLLYGEDLKAFRRKTWPTHENGVTLLTVIYDWARADGVRVVQHLIVGFEDLESGRLRHHLAGSSIPDREARPVNLEITSHALSVHPLFTGVAEK